MSQSDRAIKKLATDLARLKHEVVSWRGAQADFTSIENGGNFTFKDGDGNVTAIMGGQDDGSNTIRHVDGPIPPIPSGLSAHVDGPIVQVSWDGSFESDVTHDWHYLEVLAVGPNNEQLTGTIDNADGGSTSLAATSQGDWFITARSVSRAGKRSLDGDAGTVEVKLVGIDGALEAVQASADGKNTIYYSATMPPGTDYVNGDLWFDTSEAGGNRASVWDGAQWLSVADARVADIADAQANIDAAMVVLDGRLDAANTDIASLQGSLADLDSTTLPALRQDLDAAEVRLDSAEGQITDAFGQLDAVPGQISDARQEAIDAAQAEINQVEGTLTSMIGGKSTTKWSTSNPPAQYDGAVGDTWVKLTSLGSGGREIKRSRWQGDVWVDGRIDGAVLSNVDASTITTGFLDVANRVRAGAIAADKVLVGAGRSILPWSQVLSGVAVAPHVNRNASSTGTLFVGEPDATRGVPRHMVHDRTAPGAGVAGYIIEMRSGPFVSGNTLATRFAVSGGSWVFQGSAYTDVPDLDARLSMVWYKSDASYGGQVDSATVRLGPMPTKLSAVGDFPESAAYVIPYILTNQPGETHWVGMELSQAVGGTLIEPGGIQTPHLAADVLEVGNLKAGTAAIAEAVVQKIAAQTASIQQADVKNLFVTGTASLSDVVAERIGAETAEFINLEVANLVASGAVIDEAVIDQLFTDVVVAKMVTASEFIGENAILTGAVTTDKIAANSITAESGIIESIDLGTATVGELDGIRIMGQSIRGEQLSGDAIDGKVITGGTYRTTDGTGQWSDDGLFISKPDGTSMVRFPTDGSPLSLTASDTNIERASITDLDLSDGAVRSGGTFALASGVTPPASPPGLELGWEKVASFAQPSPGYSFDWVGIANWGTNWVRAVNVLGSAGDTLDAFEVYNADGSFEKKISLDINPRAGVTVIGDVAYTIGPDHNPANAGKLWVHGFNLNTGARVARWQFTRLTRSNQAKIAIGNDGTNLVVAGVHQTTNTLYVMRYNPATGAQIGADMLDTSYDVQYTKELQGVYITGSVAYVAHQKDTRRYSISGGTLTRTDNGWRNPETSAAGLVLASTPHLVSTSGVLYRGSLFADSTLEACYTWWDGVRETTPSPVASLAMQAARVVSVSVGRRAGLQKRLYYRVGSGDWERTTLGEDETATTIYEVNPFVPKYPLPTVNTFPNADPALLTSTNEKFQVFGDGSGKWGPLTFNADGTMTSSAVPAWVPVTTFAGSFGPMSFGFAPAYRVWPDGKVEWRGCVNIAGTTGTTNMFTVPTAARPAQYVPGVGACNAGSGGGMARIEVMQADNPADFRVIPASGTLSWVSLDGFWYYKS